MNKICLIGNPNCGKTTLFNKLTGLRQKTGNWTGVTTCKTEGQFVNDKSITIVDLPGIYSLNAISKDEKVVIDYLKNNNNLVIVNIIDGTNLKRNLLLTIQLAKLGLPMICAINFFDVLQKNKIIIDIVKLQNALGVKILPISASKGTNVNKLIADSLMASSPVMGNFVADTLEEKLVYKKVSKLVDGIITNKITKAEKTTSLLDNFFMSKVTGIPILLIILFCIYYLSNKIGNVVGENILNFFNMFSKTTEKNLASLNFPKWFIDLFCKSIFNGLGNVLSFVPNILVLFFFMGIIEESGYATRITYLFDRLFKTIGLGGKSVITLILSCGCTVTGLMSTRTLMSEKERKMTIFLAPFMPCGAKTAVFAWFSYVFFNGNALISVLMYLISIIALFVFGFVLNKLFKSNWEDLPFVMELPTLRIPSVKSVLVLLWEKSKDFLVKTGSIILAVNVLLWFLINFGFNGYNNSNFQNSFLFYIGSCFKFIFAPLGFGNWQATVAILSGIFAKESVAQSLMYISSDLSFVFASRCSVLAFMTFVLLSPPCLASILVAKRELSSLKEIVIMLLFQFVCAYLMALFIKFLELVISLNFILILSSISAIIILILSIKYLSEIAKCSQCKKYCSGGFLCRKK